MGDGITPRAVGSPFAGAVELRRNGNGRGRSVRDAVENRFENRYYDPTTTTKEDGTFALKFVRPAEQWVQVAPFWLLGSEAPPNSSKTLTLSEGQVVEDVTLVAAEEPPK
jgi:hypothetical protein